MQRRPAIVGATEKTRRRAALPFLAYRTTKYFDARPETNKVQADPTSSRDTRKYSWLHTKLMSTFSENPSAGSIRGRPINDAGEAQRCELVRASWPYRVWCSAIAARAWLERGIISLTKPVRMITDVSILIDAKTKPVSKRFRYWGSHVPAPVLSIPKLCCQVRWIPA